MGIYVKMIIFDGSHHASLNLFSKPEVFVPQVYSGIPVW